MAEPLSENIVRAIARLQLSKPLNIQTPHSLDEVVSTVVAENFEEESVQIGIDSDSVFVINSKTSEILDRKPKAEAYMQMIGATKADHGFKKKLFEENLRSAQQQMRFSLIAASLGFFIVLGGVIAMMLGYSQAGIVTSAAGIVSELVSVLFFKQARHYSERLDKTLNRLLDAEGFFKAFAIAEQLPHGEFREKLIDVIVKKMIGISNSITTEMQEDTL